MACCNHTCIKQVDTDNYAFCHNFTLKICFVKVELAKRERAVKEVRWMQDVLKRQLEEEARYFKYISSFFFP